MRRSTVKNVAKAGNSFQLVEKKSELTKKKIKKKSNDTAIKEYLLNCDKGEKKWEAGIKYWFETNVSGYSTEDGDGRGVADGYAPGWMVVELKSKRQEWLEGFLEGISRKELSFKIITVACHNTLMVFPGRNYDTDEWSKEKKSLWKEILYNCDSGLTP